MVSSSPSSLGATKSHSSRAVGMPMRCTTCRERKSRAIEANQSSTAALSPNRTLVSVLKLRGHHDVEARQRRGERFAEVPANALFEQGCAGQQAQPDAHLHRSVSFLRPSEVSASRVTRPGAFGVDERDLFRSTKPKFAQTTLDAIVASRLPMRFTHATCRAAGRCRAPRGRQ